MPVPHYPFKEEFLPKIQYNPALCQFEALSPLVLSLQALVKRPSPNLHLLISFKPALKATQNTDPIFVIFVFSFLSRVCPPRTQHKQRKASANTDPGPQGCVCTAMQPVLRNTSARRKPDTFKNRSKSNMSTLQALTNKKLT